MKPNLNVVESETPPATLLPVEHVQPAEARAQIALRNKQVIALLKREIAEAANRVQAAQTEVKNAEAAVAASKARADAALLAANRDGFRTARADEEFDTQHLATKRTALATAEAAHTAAHQPLVTAQVEQDLLINKALLHEASLHMDRLCTGLDNLLPELRAFDGSLAHMINTRVEGPFIERLGQMRQRLRRYITILNTSNVSATDTAAVAALIQELNNS